MTDAELQDLLDDPLKFCGLCWPEIKLYDKQAEILLSLRDNIETFVHAANELGKDFISAIAVIWFFASRSPCRVITSSSSETQLKSILWSEIKQRIQTSAYPLPFRMVTMKMERLLHPGVDEDVEPRSYVIGHVTNTVESFQGHHLPSDRPRVLAVFDEGSGIADEFYDAACSWADRILVIGNPLNTTNFFFRLCKGGDVKDPAGDKLYRKVIHVGGDHSPNVMLGRELEKQGHGPPYPIIIPGVVSYEDYVRRSQNWDRVKATMRLHGHFYEGEEALIFPPQWLDAAEEWYQKMGAFRQALLDELAGSPDEERREWIEWMLVKGMGVDGAEGRDLTSWTVVDRLGIIKQVNKQTIDTTEIPGQTIALMKSEDIDPRKVLFDRGGGGQQIVDRLREQGYDVSAVSFGESPSPLRKPKKRDEKQEAADDRQVYKNRRAELYGTLRERMNPKGNEFPFGISRDMVELRQELAILPLLYDSEGKMFLPPKDSPRHKARESSTPSLKSLLGRSPDRADSLVLANYIRDHEMSTVKLGAL